MVVDDRTNTILMRWPGHNDAVGEAILSEGLLAALTSNGPTSAVGIDGVRRTYRQVLIKGTYFHLLVGLSDKDAYAVARQSLRRNLIFGGLLILVVGLLGLLLHRRISRPARRLRRAIDRFREDDQAPPAPETGPTELAQVAAAFNTTVEARRRADGRFRAIVHNTSDLVIVLDAAGVVTFSGPTAVNLGVTEGMSAVELLDLVHPDDRERTLATCVGWFGSTSTGGRYEMRLGATDEDLRYLDLGAQNLLDDPAVRGVVVTGHDVSERKHFEQHLARQARHDPLTGLANRTAVIEQLARLTYGAEATPAAVLFIDLDRFKLINDSHGHRVGDQLLVALGQELERAVRPGDTVGRFGGDEFVIVAANIDDERTAGEVAQRVQDALCVPIVVEDRELFVSGSIGIALTSHDESPEALLRNADTAMYRAKEGGRNGYALFDDAMREAAVQQLQLENGLHRALERDELVLHYQPIVALADGTLSGVEALLRWQHPEHGLVAPSEFIPVAEETGLIVPIGEWVLREAASWAAVVAERAGHPVRVSVNVSARQLTQPDFLAVVDDVLVTTGLAPHLLCLEVTESLLVQDAHTATETFTALRTLGVRVSIDDFGTGYSSMSYLQQFAVDELKIDRSFINALGTDQTAGTIVGSIVGMAHAMGLEVTAEGVEGDQQLAFLRTIGCEHAQGYFFARPCVPEELEQTIAQTAQWCASAHEAV
jgi:diguanylate cyclase (GGDEF)-like protein